MSHNFIHYIISKSNSQYSMLDFHKGIIVLHKE